MNVKLVKGGKIVAQNNSTNSMQKPTQRNNRVVYTSKTNTAVLRKGGKVVAAANEYATIERDEPIPEVVETTTVLTVGEPEPENITAKVTESEATAKITEESEITESAAWNNTHSDPNDIGTATAIDMSDVKDSDFGKDGQHINDYEKYLNASTGDPEPEENVPDATKESFKETSNISIDAKGRKVFGKVTVDSQFIPNNESLGDY